jgi:hypothetical protein
MNNESSFDDVVDRLKAALEIENDKALAAELGMSPSAFANRKAAGSIPFEQIVSLAKSRKLNLDFVLLGRGEPYITPPAQGEQTFSVKVSQIKPELLAAILERVGKEFLLHLLKNEQEALGPLYGHLFELIRLSRQCNSEAEFVDASRLTIKKMREKYSELEIEKGVVASLLYNEMLRRKITAPGRKFYELLDDKVPMMVSGMFLTKKVPQDPHQQSS